MPIIEPLLAEKLKVRVQEPDEVPELVQESEPVSVDIEEPVLAPFESKPVEGEIEENAALCLKVDAVPESAAIDVGSIAQRTACQAKLNATAAATQRKCPH